MVLFSEMDLQGAKEGTSGDCGSGGGAMTKLL